MSDTRVFCIGVTFAVSIVAPARCLLRKDRSMTARTHPARPTPPAPETIADLIRRNVIQANTMPIIPHSWRKQA
jgi:hypothetical protein